MKPLYWIILVVIVLSVAAYVGWDYLTAPPGVSALASKALSGGTKEERATAARALCLDRRPGALPEVRRVAVESKDPEVLISVLNHLKELNDVHSLPAYLAAMNNEDIRVRSAGFNGARRVYSDKLPDDLTYQVDDPADKREEVVSKLLARHKNPPPAPPSAP